MKRFEPTNYDLTETAFEIYSNSDFTFQTDNEGLIYIYDNRSCSKDDLICTVANTEELSAFLEENFGD